MRMLTPDWSANGVLAASSGAFVPAQHTIYVRMQADDEVAFSILRHEITHALIHERVGDLPVPLNEGLAEYFRRYHAAGMGGQIDMAADHDGLDQRRAGRRRQRCAGRAAGFGRHRFLWRRPRPALPARLCADRVADARHGRHGGPSRRACPSAGRTLRAGPRQKRFWSESYPGGLRALAADWAAFLRDPPLSVRAY